MNAGPLRCPPAPFAGDDLVLAIAAFAHQQAAAARPSRGSIAASSSSILFLEMLARIVGIGVQQLDRHMREIADILDDRLFRGVIADQCGQARGPACVWAIESYRPPLRPGVGTVSISGHTGLISVTNRLCGPQFALPADDFGGESDIGLRAGAAVDHRAIPACHRRAPRIPAHCAV